MRKELRFHLISLGKEEKRYIYPEKICPDCDGTGNEICDNPDHGFIDAIGAKLMGHANGCPCCGHDEQYRMKYDCPSCEGTGERLL